MIRLRGVGKRYPDGTVAVQELDLDVPRGDIVVLVGPSGCGKSTTLKMVNRLVEPTSGTIELDGEDVTRVDPVTLRRRMGYVIQQIGLFPHQTVRTNVATVPRLVGWDRARTRTRVDELLELVGLDPGLHGDRYPHQLSGGQRQRVGVARALAVDPPVLLMDEPFGAVDPVVRERLQQEFLNLQQQVRKTILFVTHDIEEAVRLGDRIAVFREGGHLEQYDTPATLLGNPATPFVADFVGADRGLKRLSVTPCSARRSSTHPSYAPVSAAPTPPPHSGPRTRAGPSCWTTMARCTAGWASGSSPATGTVESVARRMDAWVPAGGTLKQAFSVMLQHDAGWVAVLDGNRLLGRAHPLGPARGPAPQRRGRRQRHRPGRRRARVREPRLTPGRPPRMTTSGTPARASRGQRAYVDACSPRTGSPKHPGSAATRRAGRS
jgi:osmoprotectant transport system ATP-binding protein